MIYLMKYLIMAKEIAINNPFIIIEGVVEVSVSILYKNGIDLNFKNSEKLGKLNNIDKNSTEITSIDLKKYPLIFSSKDTSFFSFI